MISSVNVPKSPGIIFCAVNYSWSWPQTVDTESIQLGKITFGYAYI